MKQKEEMTIDFFKKIKSFEVEYIMTEFDKRQKDIVPRSI